MHFQHHILNYIVNIGLEYIKSLCQNYLSIDNDAARQMHQTKVVLRFLLVSRNDKLSEYFMPRVYSLYNPAFIFGRRISFLICRLFFHLSFFSFIRYMWNVSSFDYLIFYQFGLVCSIKT